MQRKKVKDFSYEVSNSGEIFSLSRRVNCGYGKTRMFIGNKRIPHINKNGYLMITLKEQRRKEKRCYIHRLVAEAFIPNPKKLPQINHKDGNKLNNKVENLEWCTKSHNSKEAYRMGLMKQKSNTGERYIYYDKFSKSYRVILPNNKDMGRYKTLLEAKEIIKQYESK